MHISEETDLLKRFKCNNGNDMVLYISRILHHDCDSIRKILYHNIPLILQIRSTDHYFTIY